MASDSLSIGILIANLIVFALNLKLYTEWWKERVKDGKREK